ncbi:hypothetical protein EJ110_NYTH41616 [Nymphaea thermarum]|nr:hypothetical protein EJ110_NYTH41616 [Nymphaea thermarum]
MAHDQSLVAYITSTLSEEVLGSIDDDLTAMELWTTLATTYSQVSEARFLQLKRQFQDIKRGTRSVLEYLNEIKNVSDQLAAIGHPVSDKDKGNRTQPWTPQTGMGRGILPTPPGINATARRVPTCFYCNKKGHVKSECWHNPQNKGNQGRRENKAAAGSSSTPNVPADVQQLLMTALSKLNLKQNDQEEWYVDSGAVAHVTGETGNLSSVFSYLDKGSVVTGDGSHHTITHIGNAQISMGSSSIPLKNVLVVPSVKKNIVSVSKLIDDTHSSVEFTPSSVYVKDAQTKRTFAEGTRKGNMYVLQEASQLSTPYISDSQGGNVLPEHTSQDIDEPEAVANTSLDSIPSSSEPSDPPIHNRFSGGSVKATTATEFIGDQFTASGRWLEAAAVVESTASGDWSKRTMMRSPNGQKSRTLQQKSRTLEGPSFFQGNFPSIQLFTREMFTMFDNIG